MTEQEKLPIDISVENGNKFVVDERLLNSLIKNIKKMNFSEMKDSLRDLIDQSTGIIDLTNDLDSFLYTHKVVNHPNFPAE